MIITIIAIIIDIIIALIIAIIIDITIDNHPRYCCYQFPIKILTTNSNLPLTTIISHLPND